MPPSPNAHIVLNVRDRTGGQYNNAQFNANNQNIIQGQIHSVSLAEVNFPYDIPNVQVGVTDSFELYAFPGDLPGNPIFVITLPAGFYQGQELADAINAEIAVQGAAFVPPVVLADQPQCVYDDVSNRFRFELLAPVTAPLAWGLASDYTYPVGVLVRPNTLGKDILSMMGFLPDQENGLPAVATGPGGSLVGAQSAPLAFTQYIDICSPQLCKFQYFRDGSTTNLARRSDVICRLYITNSVAINEVEGLRPFVINRQFFNERVMRWTADNSVGTVDVQLYDDVGQPLKTTWQPRPYQITFNAYELDK